jgi:hypothetical protein
MYKYIHIKGYNLKHYNDTDFKNNKLASGWKLTEILPASCRFLATIAKKRSIIISNASKATNQLPPITKA